MRPEFSQVKPFVWPGRIRVICSAARLDGHHCSALREIDSQPGVRRSAADHVGPRNSHTGHAGSILGWSRPHRNSATSSPTLGTPATSGSRDATQGAHLCRWVARNIVYRCRSSLQLQRPTQARLARTRPHMSMRSAQHKPIWRPPRRRVSQARSRVRPSIRIRRPRVG